MSALKGRLGLETARVPHGDRHGLVWLSRGHLHVRDGTLRFLTAGSDELVSGDYALPFQSISFILLGPGSTISHDAMRLLARHGTGYLAVGEDGARVYSVPPLPSGRARLARIQAELWADPKRRREVTRTLYLWRLGEIPPQSNLNALRGIEGARMRAAYQRIAEVYGIEWRARRYDRGEPELADLPNQAINHAATVMEAAASIAVAATGTIPQLGFIHEDAGISFVLDVADLYRTEVTIPTAFESVASFLKVPAENLERKVRRLMGVNLKRKKVIPDMIDKIKELFDAGGGDA